MNFLEYSWNAHGNHWKSQGIYMYIVTPDAYMENPVTTLEALRKMIIF